MRRVGIFGGGIAGLAAAFECELHRRAGAAIDWHLYESSESFGGTVATSRYAPADGETGEWILEDGPDGWLTEKPWAAELAAELELGDQLLPCKEAEKKTWIWHEGQLQVMPDGMRLMVPSDLQALEHSPLFSAEACAAYAGEVTRAEALRHAAPPVDESVASFVRRHFGEEVLATIAAPLLSGVFGGDVEKLSVRAVMPQFVAMEHEAGSLIASLEARVRMRGHRPPQPTFTSLRHGMGSLVEALVEALPPERLHRRHGVAGLRKSGTGWLVQLAGQGVNACIAGLVPFDHLLLATPADVTRQLLQSVESLNPVSSSAPPISGLFPARASSALLVTLGWRPGVLASNTLPPGFGFLVPDSPGAGLDAEPQILAATFAHQKYAHRAPDDAVVVRAFFGDRGFDQLSGEPDTVCVQSALRSLAAFLKIGPLPEPWVTTVRRWPRSLPQYEVGHLERMAHLYARVHALGALDLLGNSYRGVGVPDLIRDARAAARTFCESLN